MSARPTLYLSNWSSHRTPGMHGPGRKFTIMGRPRKWEHGQGYVPNLIPVGAEIGLMSEAVALRGSADGIAAAREYRCEIEGRWRLDEFLSPLRLTAYLTSTLPDCPRDEWIPVRDGDTLCCACSVAESRAGRCHRAWAAPFLVRAGWRVVLDGVGVAP